MPAELAPSLTGPYEARQDRPDDPVSWAVYGQGPCDACGQTARQPLVGDLLEGDARAIAQGLNAVRPPEPRQ